MARSSYDPQPGKDPSLTLPFALSVVFDGEPVESLGRSYDTVEIDASFEDAIFETAG